MSTFKAIAITNQGKDLIAKAVLGTSKIKFTNLKTGNGTYSEAEKTKEYLETVTELKELKQTFAFSSSEVVNNSNVKLSAFITNQSLLIGYYINEIGVYAIDELDSEAQKILYAIAVADIADYLPEYNGASPVSIVQEFYTAVDNSMNVTIQAQLAAVALADDLNRLEGDVKRIISVELTVDGWTGATAPYTQSVDVEGIKESDNPIIYYPIKTNQSEHEYTQELYEYSKLLSVETRNGYMEFKADRKPIIDLSVQVKGV